MLSRSWKKLYCRTNKVDNIIFNEAEISADKFNYFLKFLLQLFDYYIATFWVS